MLDKSIIHFIKQASLLKLNTPGRLGCYLEMLQIDKVSLILILNYSFPT